jgi:hypothetical protein
LLICRQLICRKSAAYQLFSSSLLAISFSAVHQQPAATFQLFAAAYQLFRISLSSMEQNLLVSNCAAAAYYLTITSSCSAVGHLLPEVVPPVLVLQVGHPFFHLCLGFFLHFLLNSQ